MTIIPTGVSMRTVGLAERLTRYADYVARELNGLTPADATDLRVGPRMCVEAMHEAAALIELYEEALNAIADVSVFNQQRFAEDSDTDYFLRCFKAVKERALAALAKAHHPEEVLK
jgi:hypothetical protein